MKDEAGGKIIKEFLGLRPKSYSCKMFKGKEKKKCKGVKKTVVKNNISHKIYRKCLFSRNKQMRKMNLIRSHKHEIFTETINKLPYVQMMIRELLFLIKFILIH